MREKEKKAVVSWCIPVCSWTVVKCCPCEEEIYVGGQLAREELDGSGDNSNGDDDVMVAMAVTMVEAWEGEGEEG